MKMLGERWVQPVTSKRWGFVCTILSKISKLTGHRIFNHSKHIAWKKACGLS